MKTKCVIANPLELMKRYLDGKDDLSPDEREILLFALYCESRKNGGLALQAIKELGFYVQPAVPRGQQAGRHDG